MSDVMTKTDVETDGAIGVETADGVCVITIDRPAKRNALTRAMYDALADAMSDAHCDTDVRAIVLQAEGSTYTAGNDLNDFIAHPPQFGANPPAPVERFLHSLANATKPLIAAVEGRAVGVGATLLLHCDLVYLSDDAELRFPFIDLGLVPEAGSSLLLVERLGMARAAEILMLGEPVSAARALTLGLATELLPAAGVRGAARDAAVRLARKAPRALRETRALLFGDRDRLRERMTAEGRLFTELLGTDEFREAVTAFFEKRPPDFSRAG